MFENVLKRLCPCYYNRKSRSETAAYSAVANVTADSKQTSRGFMTAPVESYINTTVTGSTQDEWKGNLNLIQPQPIYALPLDLHTSAKKKQKNLLKPPLYWQKATKILHPEGPPVFQDSRIHNHLNKKPKKKKNQKGNALKHCETVADITSITSPSTIEVRWLRSQSLNNVCFEAKSAKSLMHRKHKRNRENKKELEKFSPNEVVSDFSNGVILFTAAYFNKKKTCLVNIDRLENLSRKGRDQITYYSVIKVAVLPSEKYLASTKILPNNCNPEVKQDFSFSVKELSGKVLRFSVFDASIQKQHEAIGHALLTLEDIMCDQPKKYRIKLHRRSQPHVCPGNLSLTLDYNEDEDQFGITVHKAKSLCLQKDKNVKLNTYVKVTLYSYGEKVKTKKSVLIMNSRNPSYNSTFTFQVRPDQVDFLSVTVSVKLKSFVNDITIGRLHFGPFFFVDNHKLTPWGRVFVNKESVSHWFRLYL